MNSFINKFKQYSKVKFLYFTAMLVFIAISLGNCIYTNGAALYDMLVPNYENHYWDLFTSILHCFAGTPYEEGVVYPAGANVICWIMSRFFPVDMYLGGTNAMRDSQIGMFIMIWFILGTTLVLLALIYRESNFSKFEMIIFTFTFLLSAPYIRQVTKMNIITISIIFVYVFLILKDNSKPIIQITAMICLAIAVAIKIYPVFFGLFLIKEKKWKAALSCIFIGVFVFFIPFLFFGGIDKLLLMFNNIFSTTDIFNQSGLGFKIDITNTINILGELVGYTGNIRILGTIINYLMLGLSVISFFFLKTKWQSIALISLLTLSYPTFSNSYAVIIMIPALICFFNSEKRLTLKTTIYCILFIGLFAPMCFGGQDLFPSLYGVTRVNLFTFVESICIILLELMLIYEGISQIFEKSKRKRALRV